MAGEQELKLDGAEEETEGEGGGGKKKLIIIIVAAILLIGISVGATFFLMGGLDPAPEVVEGEESAEGAEGEASEDEIDEDEMPIPAQYIPLMPEFVINYQVGARQRFLQVTIEVMTYKQSVVDALKLHDPMIRNEIIRVLSEQNFADLRTNEGRLLMQQELLKHLQHVLKKDAKVEGLEAVLFSNLVMQ